MIFQEKLPEGRIISFTFLLSALPYLCAWIDNSLFLEGDSVGILEHYSNIANTIIFPLTLHFFLRGFHLFKIFVNSLDSIIDRKDVLGKTVSPDYLKGYNPNKKFRFSIGISFTALGLCCVVINAINRINPIPIYGHDVYDSIQHAWGYCGQLVFFIFWWGIVFPYIFYRLVIIIAWLRHVFKVVEKNDMLNLQPLHPDGAGGMGNLGKMSLRFNGGVLFTFLNSFALYHTHGVTMPFAGGVFIQIMALYVVFFLPLSQPHKAMLTKKINLMEHLSLMQKSINDVLIDKLAGGFDSFSKDIDEIIEQKDNVLKIYNETKQLPTWPFNTSTISKFGISANLPVLVAIIEITRTAMDNFY